MPSSKVSPVKAGALLDPDVSSDLALLRRKVRAELRLPEHGEDAKTLEAAQQALGDCRRLLRAVVRDDRRFEAETVLREVGDGPQPPARGPPQDETKAEQRKSAAESETVALVPTSEAKVEKHCNLNPNSPKQQKWDLLMASLICLIAVFTPYEVSFIETVPGSALFWINRGVDVLFLVDMGFQFFLPIMSKGKVGVAQCSNPRAQQPPTPARPPHPACDPPSVGVGVVAATVHSAGVCRLPFVVSAAHL